VNEEAQAARDRFDTRKQAEDHFLARPLRPAPPIDFTRVSEREYKKAMKGVSKSMATFKILGSEPADEPNAVDVTIRIGNLKGKDARKALMGFRIIEQVLADDRVTFDEYFLLGSAVASITRA